MSTLHVFELDRILLHRSTIVGEVSRELGCDGEVAALEQRLARGEMTMTSFARAVHRHWAAHTPAPLSTERLDRILDDAPWVNGIDRVCADIAERGEHSLLMSSAPAWAVDAAADRFAIAWARGNPYPELPNLAGPELVPRSGLELEPEDKPGEVRWVYQHLAAHQPLELVAYGSDEVLDGPLFRQLRSIPARVRAATVKIAVNADAGLRELADTVYDAPCPDLWTAYMQARIHLHRQQPTPRAGAAS